MLIYAYNDSTETPYFFYIKCDIDVTLITESKMKRMEDRL